MPERSKEKRRSSEALQTSFIAADDAALFADLTRLRQLISDVTARYRHQLLGPDGSARPIVRSPREAADLVMAEMQELTYEEFRVMLLNSKNQVLDIHVLYKGTLNSSPVRIAEVFKPAILADAASIIPLHCHPSGDPTPSPEDVRVTAEIARAGELLDIACLDHIVIGRGRYVSLKERGLGFT